MIHFSEPVYLDNLFITDLFRESRSGHWYNEVGRYSVDGAASVTFTAPDGNLPFPTTNGELLVPVGLAVHSTLVLSAPGYVSVYDHGHLVYTQDHEFSLASLNFIPVPEPGTQFLLAVGLLTFALAVRRRMARAEP